MEKFDRKRFKPAKAIVMYRHRVNRQFAEIKDYINETNNLIIKEQNKVQKFIEDELKSLEDEDEVRGVIEFYLEDFDKYDKTYKELLMNSTFVTSFSVFEHSFLQICKYAQKEKNSTLSVSDLAGNGVVNKCKTYIEKGLEIDLSSLNQDWQAITNFNKIRNVIVHNASNFKKDKNKPIEKQELYSLITGNPFIKQKYEHMGYFYIKEDQFIIEFCNIAERYLLETIELILKNNLK
jgi:hypothetical protein